MRNRYLGSPERQIDLLSLRSGLSDKQLDNLQWAKDFMEKYERKHKLEKFSGG